MLYQLLVGMDALCALALLFSTFVPGEWKLVLGVYLAIKGLIFALSGDKVSWVDCSAGVYLFLMAFGLSYWLLTFIFIVYLIQKVIISFFSV